MRTSHRIPYLDILRILSCILIVLTHAAGSSFIAVSPLTAGWHAMNFYDCLGILGVPLFIMISGALMLNPDYSLPFKKLLAKTGRLVLLYFLWLFFYNMVAYLSSGSFGNVTVFKEDVMLKTLAGNGVYHLWFLPMLAGLYIATPVFRAIVTSRKITFYFLCLFFVWQIFIPTLLLFQFPYRTIIEGLYNQFPLTIAVKYSGYYLLGYYLHHDVTLDSPKKVSAAGILGTLFFLATVLICSIDAVIKNTHSIIVNDPFSITDFSACTCIFLFVKHIFYGKKSTDRFLSALSDLSFGIYFIHPFIITLITGLGFTTLSFHPVISVPVFTIAVFALSLCFTWLLRLIPRIGRFLTS